jgi:hypothetical protein
MDRSTDFLGQTKYLVGLIGHDCKGALSRIESLLSELGEGESSNATDIAAELDEARLEMYEVLRGTERLEALCDQELESRS